MCLQLGPFGLFVAILIQCLLVALGEFLRWGNGQGGPVLVQLVELGVEQRVLFAAQQLLEFLTDHQRVGFGLGTPGVLRLEGLQTLFGELVYGFVPTLGGFVQFFQLRAGGDFLGRRPTDLDAGPVHRQLQQQFGLVDLFEYCLAGPGRVAAQGQ